jgi:PhoH-like ATPase
VTHNTLEEKMEPWIAPIKDNLSFLLNSKNGATKRKTKGSNTQSSSFNDPYFDILKEQGKIEVEAISFIRGRSLPNAYIIVEESQNLSIHELKTILTRVGHGTKIVLTGDIEQIDDSHLDIFTNGLSHCVQKFKNEPISGHVTLIKGERSELATIASKIL